MSSSPPPPPPKTPLFVALRRIAIGIAFGATVIAILFSGWGFLSDGTSQSPEVGTLVFLIIVLVALGFTIVSWIYSRVKKRRDEREVMEAVSGGSSEADF